jgi:hypothetical protein
MNRTFTGNELIAMHDHLEAALKFWNAMGPKDERNVRHSLMRARQRIEWIMPGYFAKRAARPATSQMGGRS